MWRFVLGEGVCGGDAWAGLLVPSVDKVGRYFPLTFALPLPAEAFDLQCIASCETWYTELERIASVALRAESTVDELEAALSSNPLTRERANAATSAALLADWWDARTPARLVRRLDRAESLAGTLEGTARLVLTRGAVARTFWWSADPQSGETELHCSYGLPEPETYAALLASAAVPDLLPLDPLQALAARM
jgi:type VI secretion system protein ImpM